jgi:ABC-2 type transport system ATP-binding protein
MAGSGTTVLVTTHYMEEAEQCGRVLLMNRGRRIALDSPASLRADLATPILEIRTDDPARAAVALSDLEGVQDATMFGRAVHVVADREEGIRERIAGRLAEGGLDCRSIERVPPTLEDVFVARVREAGGVVAG